MVGEKKVLDRDGLARWYANRHLKTDEAVQEIYYLPQNAPPNEIRLIEVNTLVSDSTTPEPIDFGVDIGGAEGHKLFVLDVTPKQWKAIQDKKLVLPAGWEVDKGQKFGRT